MMTNIRTIALYAILAAALASCAKTEHDVTAAVQSEISFDAPVVGNVTKADMISGLFPTDSAFCVFADHHYDLFADAEADSFTAYMRGPDEDGDGYQAGVIVTYHTDVVTAGDKTFDSYWKPAASYYWPKDGYLTFAAYAPQFARKRAAIGYDVDRGMVISQFRVSKFVDQQYDFMVSDRLANQKSSDMVQDSPDPYDGVQLTFRHVLSAIKFEAKTMGDYASAGYTVKVQKVSILNPYATADFHQFSGRSSTEVDLEGMWTSYKGDVDMTVVVFNAQDEASKKLVTDTPAAITEETADAILLPQVLHPVDGKAVFAEVVYEVSHPDMGGKSLTYTATLDLSLGKMDDDTPVSRWEPGKRYKYTITIGMDEVVFAPKVTGWEPEITIPDVPMI